MINSLRNLSDQVLRRSRRLHDASAADLLALSRTLIWEARSGIPLKKLLPDAFSLVCEASRRTLDMEPYPVQVMAGCVLFDNHVAEMQTGEGKTLTATLPTYLRALVGKGCHVATTNDYLAQRDAEQMGKLFNFLGLETGCIQTDLEDDQRRCAYQCDVTYGTAKEFGFDFLRDRLKVGTTHQTTLGTRLLAADRSEQGTVQRGHYFVLVDEADSILIDEAVTPLLIGLPQTNTVSAMSLLSWSHRMADLLEPVEDFEINEPHRSVTLTEQGAQRVILKSKPKWIDSLSYETILEHVETVLASNIFYKRDREYVVQDREVSIVDESTGRMMPGRKWQHGLHQAIEFRESVPITEITRHAAQVTVQNFFRLYDHLAGMTGTAMSARRELRSVYGLKVEAIATHRPCLRKESRPRIFASTAARNQAVLEEVIEMRNAGRAVLIGTPTVSDSEELGHFLHSGGIETVILNAKFPDREAEIVAQAGQPGRVTISTNMAGRGTDIKPAESVVRNGGLHVIVTSMHRSARIDRQLVGRTARQGDPGSFRFMLSLEDRLLDNLNDRQRRTLAQLKTQIGSQETSLAHLSFFREAQKDLERRHRRVREDYLKTEENRHKDYQRMGLDPYLECAEM